VSFEVVEAMLTGMGGGMVVRDPRMRWFSAQSGIGQHRMPCRVSTTMDSLECHSSRRIKRKEEGGLWVLHLVTSLALSQQHVGCVSPTYLSICIARLVVVTRSSIVFIATAPATFIASCTTSATSWSSRRGSLCAC
jgi:hypothetical protein